MTYYIRSKSNELRFAGSIYKSRESLDCYLMGAYFGGNIVTPRLKGLKLLGGNN